MSEATHTTFERIRATMVEMFELDPESVTLDARVFEDLDLDSIDAIDLVARLQSQADDRIPRVDESALRGVRTVADIVHLADSMLAPATKRPATG